MFYQHGACASASDKSYKFSPTSLIFTITFRSLTKVVIMSRLSHNAMPRLSPHDYTIGWISALPIEYTAAAVMLDERHEPPARRDNDPTLYTLGRIHNHNVVIACLPTRVIGTESAANVATHLMDRFPNIKFGLMVGIGGGVPSRNADIRLGDVVVSQPSYGHGGVIQYDMGKRLPNGQFECTSHLNKPPMVLLNALAELQRNHVLERGSFLKYLSKLEESPNFNRQSAGIDQLFQPNYQHPKGPNCTGCSTRELVKRNARSKDALVQFHYGTVASGNSVMRDAIERDNICRSLGGNVFCFEMEAAGLMDTFPCLVIRGICDYSDSHKNKKWQPYASATAAAYAKAILSAIRPTDVANMAPAKSICHTIRKAS
jgi:nucleoside phosphorylase